MLKLHHPGNSQRPAALFTCFYVFWAAKEKNCLFSTTVRNPAKFVLIYLACTVPVKGAKTHGTIYFRFDP
jgi:hypothetical protein